MISSREELGLFLLGIQITRHVGTQINLNKDYMRYFYIKMSRIKLHVFI